MLFALAFFIPWPANNYRVELLAIPLLAKTVTMTIRANYRMKKYNHAVCISRLSVNGNKDMKCSERSEES